MYLCVDALHNYAYALMCHLEVYLLVLTQFLMEVVTLTSISTEFYVSLLVKCVVAVVAQVHVAAYTPGHIMRSPVFTILLTYCYWLFHPWSVRNIVWISVFFQKLIPHYWLLEVEKNVVALMHSIYSITKVCAWSSSCPKATGFHWSRYRAYQFFATWTATPTWTLTVSKSQY